MSSHAYTEIHGHVKVGADIALRYCPAEVVPIESPHLYMTPSYLNRSLENEATFELLAATGAGPCLAYVFALFCLLLSDLASRVPPSVPVFCRSLQVIDDYAVQKKQRHLLKLTGRSLITPFSCISSAAIPETAVAMLAKDGERVPFHEVFHMTGAVETWLTRSCILSGSVEGCCWNVDDSWGFTWSVSMR